MKKAAFTIALLLVCGCVSYAGFMPGNISERTSQIDGNRTVHMVPAYVYKADGSSANLRVGLFWTATEPDLFLITATIPIITRISPKNSLRFNVDGQVLEMSDESGRLTEIYNGSSSRSYPVDRAFVERIINAKSVVVEFSGFEGLFSQDGMQSARPAFQEFLLKVPAPKARDVVSRGI